MKWMSVFLVALLAFVPTTTFWPEQAEAQNRTAGTLTVPVTGKSDSGAQFDGAFTISRFAIQAGKVVAIGNLVGTVTDAANNTVNTVATSIAMPLDTSASGGAARTASVGTLQVGECDILHLVLGPLDIDLLGLEIHLDQVVLDIVAQAGAGNLLGNLLCAIVGLLDPLGPLAQLVELLNQLLALLGG
jgi:hypothetical protein